MKLSDLPLIDLEALGHPNNQPVGGKYAITGTADTLEFIKKWQEDNQKPFYGYYRITESPISRRITESLKSHYEVRHALLYASVNSALYEWIDYFVKCSKQTPLLLVDDLKKWEWVAQIVSALGGRFSVFQSFQMSFKAKQPVVFAFEQINLKIQDCLQQAQKARASVAYLSDHLESLPPQEAKFFIADFKDEQANVLGGAVLSSVDLPMEVLAKRRAEVGCVLSPRNADFLSKKDPAPMPHADEDALQRNLCQLEGANHGILFCTGMQAIVAAQEVLKTGQKNRFIVIGVLYKDTYVHLLEDKAQHLFLGADELHLLEDSFDETIAGVITETITNPLNQKINLPEIAKICQAHQVPFIVDNTLATPVNCQPLKLGASFSIHSTVKYLSGGNDHAGGVLFADDLVLARRLKDYQQLYALGMSPLEVNVLSSQLVDFKERMVRFEKNVSEVAKFLSQSPKVGKLYYQDQVDDFCQGRGSMISFTLDPNHLETLKKFYDSLELVKAPTLGSNETLVCPYTLLTYYHQTDDFLQEIGLPRYLVRIAVGCEEDLTPVITALQKALDLC